MPWPLMFGTAMHEALDAYYRSNRDMLVTETVFDGAWEAEDERLQEEYAGLYEYAAVEWRNHYELGLAMLRNYDKFDRKERFFKKVLDIGIEERGFIDIVAPTSTERLPGRPLLSGRLDLVVERPDGVWIVDHKTAIQKPSNAALDVDDQITAYCYIYWRLTGVVPRGAMYNVLLKEAPRAPKILKSGKPSTNKAQKILKPDYVRALKECGIKDMNSKPVNKADVSTYGEMLASLDARGWSDFFVRHYVKRTEEELKSFEQRLYHEMNDMQRVLDDPEQAYPNPNQRNCAGCAILPLCRALEEQGDVEDLLEHMYEVKPPRHEIPPAMFPNAKEGNGSKEKASRKRK